LKISAEDYASYKDFLSYFIETLWAEMLKHPDNDPVKVQAQFEAKSPAKARMGLAVAIGDCLEYSESLPPKQVMLADEHLSRNGLPTISYLRARHRSGVDAILKRGKIRNEREYRAVRNVVELIGYKDEQHKLWKLLDEFENHQASD
jgi:hypothetical protein